MAARQEKDRADLVLANDGSPDELRPRVDLAFAALRPPPKPRPAPRAEMTHRRADKSQISHSFGPAEHVPAERAAGCRPIEPNHPETT